MAEETKGFWTSLPGILTGIAAVISAVGGLFLAFGSQQSGQAASAVSASGNSATIAADVQAPEAAWSPTFPLRARVSSAVDRVRLKQAPDLESAEVAIIHPSTIFYVARADGEWLPARVAGGKQGFVLAARVTVLDEAPTYSEPGGSSSNLTGM